MDMPRWQPGTRTQRNNGRDYRDLLEGGGGLHDRTRNLAGPKTEAEPETIV